MAAELRRKGSNTIILAMHPGEVATWVYAVEATKFLLTKGRDIVNVPLGGTVEGIISVEQSVSGMVNVITTKTSVHHGTFWTWQGYV